MANQYRILVIEDCTEHADLIRRALSRREQHDVTVVGSMKSALEALADCEPFDSALLDLSLPDSDFQQTLNRISDIAALTAVLVLTSEGGNDVGDQAILACAQSFIVKSELIDTQIDEASGYSLSPTRSASRYIVRL